MNIREFFLGKGEFKSAEDIIDTIRKSRNFDASRENTTAVEALLIFQTSKQQTWLVATTVRLYCVLDDLAKSFTRVVWSIRDTKIIRDGQIVIDISTSDDTKSTGLLNIGDHRRWLFSKRLFTNESLESRIGEMIHRQMVNNFTVDAGSGSIESQH